MKDIPEEIPLLAKIKNKFSKLSASEKHVAEYITTSPENLLQMTLQEFSASTGVSEATVIRFCKSLGYSGYSQLKLIMAQEHGKNQAMKSYFADDCTILLDEPIDRLPLKVISHTIRALEDTLGIFDKVELARAVEAIAKARQVLFVGVGTSGCTAGDAYSKFMRLGIRCSVLTDAHMQLMTVSNMSSEDVLVAFTHSGMTCDTVDVARRAQSRGVTVICSTNNNVSLITECSDIKLLTACYETGFHTETMISRILQLAIIDMLYLGVMLTDPERYSLCIAEANKAVEDRCY